jgi:anaerobic ribonucleoside-triphosphate reductase activating protein
MEPDNQRALLPLLRRLKREYPTKTVWCYSGYTYEELTGVSRARCEVTDEMLGYIDVLVDGEFVLEKRNISLRFRGSDNQRLIDLPRTREQGTVTLWED